MSHAAITCNFSTVCVFLRSLFRLFVLPFYCGLFLEQSLTLNRRQDEKDYTPVEGKVKQCFIRHPILILFFSFFKNVK